MAPATAPYRMP